MKVIIRGLRRARERNTYQASWPESIKCPKCKEEAPLMMVVDDGKGEVASLRPEGVKIWPHNSMAIAHYFCSNCGELETRWNQA